MASRTRSPHSHITAMPAIAPTKKLFISLTSVKTSCSPRSKRSAGQTRWGPISGHPYQLAPGLERTGEALEGQEAHAAGSAHAGAILGCVVAPVGEEQP